MFYKLSKKSAVLAVIGCITAAGLFSVSAEEIPGEPLPPAPPAQTVPDAPVQVPLKPYKISDSILNYFTSKKVITAKQAAAMEQCMDAIYWENKAQMKKYKADRMTMEEDLIQKAKLTAAQTRALFPISKADQKNHGPSFYGPRFSIPDYVQSFVANKMITLEQADILIKELAVYQEKGRAERRAYGIHIRQNVMDAAKKAEISEETLTKLQVFTQLYDSGMGSQVLEGTPMPALTPEQQASLEALQTELHEKNVEQMTLFKAARLRIIAEATEQAGLTADQAHAVFPGKSGEPDAGHGNNPYFDSHFSVASHIQKLVDSKIITQEQADILRPALETYQKQCLEGRKEYDAYMMEKIESAARQLSVTPGQIIRYLHTEAKTTAPK